MKNLIRIGVNMKGTIDRFEGNYAVCEIDGQIKNLPKDLFPKDAKEGDIFLLENKVRILDKETEERENSIGSLFDRLKNKKVNA